MSLFYKIPAAQKDQLTYNYVCGQTGCTKKLEAVNEQVDGTYLFPANLKDFAEENVPGLTIDFSSLTTINANEVNSKEIGTP